MHMLGRHWLATAAGCWLLPLDAASGRFLWATPLWTPADAGPYFLMGRALVLFFVFDKLTKKAFLDM